MLSPKAKTAIASMPPLSHWPDRSVPFEWAESDVLAWITSHPHVCQWLFDAARNSRTILFDPESGLWFGRDWTP